MSGSYHTIRSYMVDNFSIENADVRYFFDNLYKMNMLYYEPFLLSWAYWMYIDSEFSPILDINKFSSKYISDDIIIHNIETKSTKSIPKNINERKKYIFRTRTTLIRYYETIMVTDKEFANINMTDDEYIDAEDDDKEYDHDIDENIEDDNITSDYYGEQYDDQYDMEDAGDNSNDTVTNNVKSKGKGKAKA